MNKDKLIANLTEHAKGYEVEQILNYIHSWASHYNESEEYDFSDRELFEIVDEVVFHGLGLL
jgi:hypothetical protein